MSATAQSWSAQSLQKRPVKERLALCPTFLQELLSRAVNELSPKRIWVFGSRARGDQQPLSDYDLAVDFGGAPPPEWSRFLLDTEEKASTLLKIDMVDYQAASAGMKTSIEKGVLLYER